ncbi:hypothetical protein JHK82_051569 [Glycine max]|uniref:Uncharacterized protein n=1 Tax=Glycine max TaxID=3847 RepID=A0A0R0F441_SOYBN|nr:hypothetical protein JHK86_051409 [Glycine max]KAG4937354.1 hypothetical protein JHK85_052273 [Glycine max]KAG5092791.1 hypothetical protein JHK82_051569 [Glycine max]KAG5095852.1 hypothetical protein JHK84_051440 [Glycine max]KAH1156090.1 hypothetical protein GYH30_051062 [Glycine max]
MSFLANHMDDITGNHITLHTFFIFFPLAHPICLPKNDIQLPLAETIQNQSSSNTFIQILYATLQEKTDVDMTPHTVTHWLHKGQKRFPFLLHLAPS